MIFYYRLFSSKFEISPEENYGYEHLMRQVFFLKNRLRNVTRIEGKEEQILLTRYNEVRHQAMIMGKEMRTKYLRQIFLKTWKIREIDRRAEQELTKYETRKKYSRRNTSTVTEPSTSSTGLNNPLLRKMLSE